MPGMAMYDFGDAVRFLASTAAEDEADLTKVSLDIGKFTAFAEGFVGKIRDSLTAEEIDGMALGAFSVTVELAARFLDDYLNGDVYFRTDSPIHNLVRARCQLRLAEDMQQKLEKLRAVVAGIAGRSCAN
ncbi:MAG: mucin desulfatase, partial [Eubacteriales bacterium]